MTTSAAMMRRLGDTAGHDEFADRGEFTPKGFDEPIGHLEWCG